MMKIRRYTNKRLHIALLFCVLSACVFLSSGIKCSAESYGEDEINASIDGAIEDFYDAIPDSVDKVDGDSLETLGVKHVLESVICAITDNSSELTSLLLSLLGVALLGGMSTLFDGELSSYTSRAIGGISAALLFERIFFLVDGAVATLGEVNTFFSAVIPISLGINSLGASPTTASVQAVGMGVTLGAYSFICEKVLGSVVCAVFFTSALSSVDPILSRVSQSIRNLFMSLLGALTVFVGATFSLQSTIAAGTDSVAIRSARYAVSGAIPIVGGAVSGALGIVAGGVTYARGVVGGGAIAVVLSLLLTPLVTLLAYRMCLRIGITFCSWCSLDGCQGVLSAFSGALDTLIAVYSLTAVLYTLEFAAFLKGGVDIA